MKFTNELVFFAGFMVLNYFLWAGHTNSNLTGHDWVFCGGEVTGLYCCMLSVTDKRITFLKI